MIASLIETAKLNGVDPQAWLANTPARLAAGHHATALDALMPWNPRPPRELNLPAVTHNDYTSG